MAADISSGCNLIEITPNGGLKFLQVDTAATADDGDTIAITLADYGIKTFMGVYGCIHTTSNSVVTQEDPTTAVVSGVLTLTIAGSTDNKIRSYLIWGK